MKIKAKIIAISLLLIHLFSIIISADEGNNWYIVKKEGSLPGFPADCDFLNEHQCYYVDKSDNASQDKILYLTFDAGYENGNISKILDILKEENVPGAFFVLSNLINKNTDIIDRMVKEGHLVCNHTKNHKDMTKLTKEEMAANLKALEDLCYDKTGYVMPKYFRYPEGHYNKQTVLIAEELGYKTFFWSMSHADWDNANQPNPNRAIDSLKRNTHPGAVILLHPTSATNVEILPSLIAWWKSEGYSFGSLDDFVSHLA